MTLKSRRPWPAAAFYSKMAPAFLLSTVLVSTAKLGWPPQALAGDPAPGSVAPGGTGSHNNVVEKDNYGVVGNNNTVTLIQVWSPGTAGEYPGKGQVSVPREASATMGELAEVMRTQRGAFAEALAPFAALGIHQPDRGGGLKLDPELKLKPISYQKLFGAGALTPDAKGQQRLVHLAITKEDSKRPRWPMKQASPRLWARNDAYRELVANAQKWINAYHEEMVQLGILTP